MTKEIKMHTTIYWEVPEDKTTDEWIAILKSLPKDQALDLATDYGDSEFEVNL
jgi:hypothetical protein